jgi:hypothetical protein
MRRNWSKQVPAPANISQGTKAILLPKLGFNFIQMASPKFSFTFITPQEFENCRKASAVGAATASLPVDPVTACKPPRKFSAPVCVVSKLKKKEPLATSSLDCTLHNARVKIPVFAMGCLPTIITVIKYCYLCAFIFSFVLIFAGIRHFVLEFCLFGILR